MRAAKSDRPSRGAGWCVLPTHRAERLAHTWRTSRREMGERQGRRGTPVGPICQAFTAFSCLWLLTRSHPGPPPRLAAHTFGTAMAAAGVPMRTLQEWMGHRDMATTQRYADYAPNEREVEMVDRALATIGLRSRALCGLRVRGCSPQWLGSSDACLRIGHGSCSSRSGAAPRPPSEGSIRGSVLSKSQRT